VTKAVVFLHLFVRKYIMVKQFIILMLLLLLSTGCYVHKKTTNSEKTVLFPIFSAKKTQQFHDNGNISKLNDRGSALIIANWRKDFEYDTEGRLIKKTEKSVLFPIWSIRKEENQNRIKEKGSILLVINYDDEKPKKAQKFK